MFLTLFPETVYNTHIHTKDDTTKMAKTVEEKFKKLDEIEHCLLRPGRYIGSVSPHTAETYVVDTINDKMVSKEITWCPALIKVFDEVISNSVDHSKTEEGKHVSVIKVELSKETGEISVYDDGGIVVKKHKEHDQWVPEMIFELRAGSNFNDEDDSMLTGQNGEGAALTSIFSKEFHVRTADGKNQFDQTHLENSRKKSEPKVKSSDKNFTKITWTPDYEKFGLKSLDQGNYDKLVKRVYDVAGCNPKLKVYLNGSRITIKSFEDYVKFYTEEFIYEENDSWRIAVAHSDDGFEHVSFVNGTETTIGGNHIDYVGLQVWNKLREYFNKKHKVDIKPSQMKEHMKLFIDCDIIKPRYSSQTKEDLITEPKNFGTSVEISDKFINKIVKSNIIQSVLDWVAAKEYAEQMKSLKSLNKDAEKTNPSRVEKFADALEKRDRQKCVLFLTEGDSAAKAVLAGKGKNPFIGSFPLRGKPLNVREKDLSKIIANEEIKKIMIITGLKIGEKVTSLAQIRFGKIAFTTDADVDGAHISGLLLNFFTHFWPELLDLGVLSVFRTPLVKVFMKDKTLEFFNEREFHTWEETEGKKIKTWKHKFYKGLGTSTSAEFKQYFENMDKHLFHILASGKDDLDAIDLAFNSERADDRKVWLETPAEQLV